MIVRASAALARRAVRNSFRRPQLLAPLVIFPTLLLAVNVGGLSETTSLEHFPDTGFLDFQLAASITQALLIGGVTVGIATALDIENGFFDRLVVAPIPRTALVLGRLGQMAVLAMFVIAYFLTIGLVFGASIAGGVPGVLVVAGIAATAGVAFAGIGLILALNARRVSTVQGIFPLVFVILFLSSAFFPMSLLEAPAKWVAAYNPLSYIADGIRTPIIAGLQAGPILQGFAAAAGLALITAALSVISLRGRLRRG